MADQFNTQLLEDTKQFKLYSLSWPKPRLVGVFKTYSDALKKAERYENYKITEIHKRVTERDRVIRTIT